MTKWQKGYKLIGRERLSLCVSYKNSRRVLYPVLEEARPPPGAGPLTVFSTKYHIRLFFKLFHWGPTATVVRCLYRATADQSVGLWGSSTPLELVTKHNAFKELPRGTVLADVVICLE